jgi:hypothetical protein
MALACQPYDVMVELKWQLTSDVGIMGGHDAWRCPNDLDLVDLDFSCPESEQRAGSLGYVTQSQDKLGFQLALTAKFYIGPLRPRIPRSSRCAL